ncbi:hypothetical protein RCL1_008226 [Eukaryota sp. TZLM3-RCL]
MSSENAEFLLDFDPDSDYDCFIEPVSDTEQQSQDLNQPLSPTTTFKIHPLPFDVEDGTQVTEEFKKKPIMASRRKSEMQRHGIMCTM